MNIHFEKWYPYLCPGMIAIAKQHNLKPKDFGLSDETSEKLDKNEVGIYDKIIEVYLKALQDEKLSTVIL